MNKLSYITPRIKVHALNITRIMDNLNGGSSGEKDEIETDAKSSSNFISFGFDDS